MKRYFQNWLRWWRYQDYLRIARSGINDMDAYRRARTWRGFFVWLTLFRVNVSLGIHLAEQKGKG